MVLALVLIAAIFYYLLKDISLAEVWAAITAMTWSELAGLALVAGWNLCTYAFVWMTVTPGLTFGRAMIMTQATTAITNTVPAGSAIGVGMTYAMLGGWGFSRSRTTIAVLVSGVWNAFAKLAIPVLALALVALQGNASAGRLTAALVGIAGLVAAIVVFALMLRSEEQAAQVRGAGRPGRLPAAGPDPPAPGAGLGDRHRQVPHPHHRPARAPAGSRSPRPSLVSHLSLYLVLLVALRDVGVSNAEVGWAEVLAVFAFARLATAIPFTPGGAGVVEAALIAGLVAAGGDKPEVVAAVLVYRALTWAPAHPGRHLLPALVAQAVADRLGRRHRRLDRGRSAMTRGRRVERRPTDLIWLVTGAVVLLLCALPVHADRVGGLEADLFRLVNDLPSVPFTVVWVPMQLGNLLVVPAAVLAALAFRRWRLAGGLALAGAGVYVLAKVVKRFVERGRPSDVLDDVVVRGAAPHGLGFVSGHIAVVTSLALVAWPWLPRWGRWAAGLAVAAVFLTRMYVGAHLPLDMVGGAALGVAVGALVRLLLGVPARDPGPADDTAATATPDAEQAA